MSRRAFVAKAAVAAAASLTAVVGLAPAASANEVQWYGWDLTGDGWWESYFADANGDGYYDVARFDRNLDGIQDGAAFDLFYNGRFDLYGVDNNQNGYWEVVGRDLRDAGTIDEVIVDMNENGIRDEQEIATGPGTGTMIISNPNFDGLSRLMMTMAGIYGTVTYGASDSDHDGWNDRIDRSPYDSLRF